VIPKWAMIRLTEIQVQKAIEHKETVRSKKDAR
jgi:hypothetical protein